MKHISFSQCEGQALKKVFLCSNAWKALPTKSVVSNGRSFEIKAGRESWLVLDTYGNYDNGVSPAFAKLIFGPLHLKLTAAIHKKTGAVVTACFYRFEGTDPEKEGYGVGFGDLYQDHPTPIIPASYMARLDELQSAKRPFAFTFDVRDVCDFHTRDMSRANMRESLRIRLFFSKGECLELRSGMCRTISAWDDEV